MKEIRVLLVDDHEITRRGVRGILEQEEDIEIVGDCSSAEEALQQAEILLPNIILMEAKMPGMDGIEATRRYCQKRTPSKIIMLTLCEDCLAEALEAGAVGYLLKDIKHQELTRAIRQVHHGEVVISDSITAKSRIAYEEKFGNNTKGSFLQERGNPMPEEVQMVIPPPVDANQLIRFVSRVEEMLQSRTLQLVGTWKGDTAITIALPKPTPLTNILNKLEEMPEVGTIGEEPLTGEADPSLLKKVANMPKLNTKIRKTVFITLKDEKS